MSSLIPESNPIPYRIIHASPPRRVAHNAGRKKSLLRAQLESLQPGQCLQWRMPLTASNITSALHNVRRDFRNRTFTIRKVNLGYDIYRVEDKAV